MGVFTAYFLPAALPLPCHKHERVYMQQPFAARPATLPCSLLPLCLIFQFGIRSAEKPKEERNDLFFQRLLYPSVSNAVVVQSLSGRGQLVGALTTLAGLHELPDETDWDERGELARLVGRAKHPPI